MDYIFRKANPGDLDQIWAILQEGITRRKAEGSQQWQDGYPNPTVVALDIEAHAGHVLVTEDQVIGYCALLLNNEPAYANIEGKWLTDGEFVVLHRLAISANYLGKGLGKRILKNIEKFALEQQVYSIKADTNYDNIAMLKTFENMGFVYCGEVYFRGSPRKAFEKVLEVN